jgi:hypothetical protein
MVDEMQAMRERLDRLESLVGTAYGESGTVIPALLNAMNQTDPAQARHEVGAVIGFLRDNRP